LWLALLCTLAYFVPDGFAWCQDYLSYLFAAIMFAVGWLLPRDELRELARRWPTVVLGTCVQYGLMPILGYTLGLAFHVGPEMMIGMVLVGAVPGAMASNVVTLTARGHVSYSVSLTTLATLLSPVVVPACTYLALRTRVEIDPLQQFWQLTWVVVLPVVFGHVNGRVFERHGASIRRLAPTAANATILWVIAVIVAAKGDRLHQVTWAVLLALLSVNVLGYLGGYLAGRLLRLPDSMVRALTIEVGMQNAGLGALLATSRCFDQYPGAALPPAIYSFGCMMTGTVLAQWWSRRPNETDAATASAASAE